MKVLVYMSGGFDAHGPSNHLFLALMEDILQAGHSVHLIERHTSGVYSDVPETLKASPRFSYDVVKSKVVEKSAFAKRYLTLVQYAFKSIRHLRKQTNVDVVFVQSCATAPFQVAFAKVFTRKPVIYNIQDMFPGSSIASGVMRRKWMQYVFFLFQKIAYLIADHISVISDDMKRCAMEQGVPDGKISIIVNWYDDRAVREIDWERNRFVTKYGLSKEKFYVQYAGTMGYVFDYNMVLDVAEELRSYTNIEFQMVGEGSQRDAFICERDRRGLSNIVFYPLQSQDMVSDVYSACSVCLIPLKKGVIGNSVPSKAALLMACKRAIINSVDEDSGYFRMFNDNEIGVSISNDDPKGVATAILDLYNDEQRRESYAMNACMFGQNHYSRSVNTRKYIELLEHVAGRPQQQKGYDDVHR